MAEIFVFNAGHDYALASFSPFYTSPASVVELEKRLCQLPSLWCTEADIIWDGISSLREIPDITSVRPWGWNPQIRHRLIEAGIDPGLMPSEKALHDIRRLSHRNLTIPFNKLLLESGLAHKEAIPQEFKTTEEAMDFYFRHPDSYFKAPWSSSGRGVIRCSDLLPRHIEPWIHGIIRRQGSVIAETAASRTIDFASLWHTVDGEAEFCGWSLFEVSSRGKYHGNFVASQDEISNYIERFLSPAPSSIIEAQRQAITTLIAPHYTGPLGIDMLADADCHFRPCVEINIRNTMGHVALHTSKRKCEEKGFAHLFKFF